MMAKYSRFDPRNKKKNRKKDQYLDRTPRPKDVRRQDEEQMYREYKVR